MADKAEEKKRKNNARAAEWRETHHEIWLTTTVQERLRQHKTHNEEPWDSVIEKLLDKIDILLQLEAQVDEANHENPSVDGLIEGEVCDDIAFLIFFCIFISFTIYTYIHL